MIRPNLSVPSILFTTGTNLSFFFDATRNLEDRSCPSVRPSVLSLCFLSSLSPILKTSAGKTLIISSSSLLQSVRPSVRPSVCLSVCPFRGERWGGERRGVGGAMRRAGLGNHDRFSHQIAFEWFKHSQFSFYRKYECSPPPPRN